MKRRSFVHLVAAAPPLAAQTLPPKSENAAVAPNARNEPIARNVETTPADTVCDSKSSFFTPVQLASLTRLCEVLMPSGALPGAIHAGVPAFLDFLIGASPSGVQQMYRTGLDGLEQRSRSRFGKAFAALSPGDSATLLASLNEAWAYDPPRDPVTRFLLAAKQDVYTATVNSREYSEQASAGRRSAAGIGQYWYSLD
jgi:hypothetical protein